MPSIFAELPPSFGRSAEDGKLSDTRTRSFRILLTTPNEVFNPQSFVGVAIGDPHPWDSSAYCVGVRCEFDGDSRMAVLAHFDYKQAAGKEDNKNQEPSVRPANWSTDTSTTELPASSWWDYYTNALEVAQNPARDMYDGVSRSAPVTTISIEQYEATDPTRHAAHVGSVNSSSVTIGSLECEPHSLMLRGIGTKPHVEAFGQGFWRGWLATYQFVYRYNYQLWHSYNGDGSTVTQASGNAGWDVVHPMSGFNIINTGLNGAVVDNGALTLKLKLDDDSQSTSEVAGWPAAVQYAPDTFNEKARANVLIGSQNGKAFQRPSTLPVPLNPDGSPRRHTLAIPIILTRKRTQPEIDFSILGLRLY